MLARSDRVRPCRLRWNPSLSGRSTVMTPSLTRIFMSGCIVEVRDPRGPLTVTTFPSATSTSTPPGTSIGCFPIRLMRSSPHEGEDLAADAFLGCVAVRHDSLRRGHDRDAQSAQHARQLVALRVDAAAGRGDPLDAGDRPLAPLAVLQPDAERLLDALALAVEPVDVALLLRGSSGWTRPASRSARSTRPCRRGSRCGSA